jgi:hypothetical protein
VVQQIKDEGALPVILISSSAIKKAYCPRASTGDATKSKTTSAVSGLVANCLRYDELARNFLAATALVGALYCNRL